MSFNDAVMPHAAGPRAGDLNLAISRRALWLLTTVALAIGVYYFVGGAPGAGAGVGSDLPGPACGPDGRHFLGCPCH